MLPPNPLPPLPPRTSAMHKGNCGRVLVVAGSVGMVGAAALTATAALRSGSGYVEIITPAPLLPALTKAVPEAMVHSCGNLQQSQLGAADISVILQAASRADAIVVGPGLGPADDNAWLPELLSALQQQHPQLPLVLDADGLNQLATASVDLDICSSNMILTPHPGEAARLLRWTSAAVIQANRVAAAAALAACCTATFVLKGAGTLVVQQDQPCWRNSSGNVGMATAGSGDVLSGHLGALLASGLSAYSAARLGSYLHGRAGDLFVAEWGVDGLTASDLASWISKAMREWRRNPVEIVA